MALQASPNLSEDDPSTLAPGADQNTLVHVALRWNRPRNAREVVGAGFDWTSASGVVLMVATLWGLGLLDRVVAGGIDGWFFVPAALGALLAPVVWRWWRLRGAPGWIAGAIDEWSNDRFRLRLIAGAGFAEHVRRLDDALFEPLVFRVARGFATRGGRSLLLPGMVLSVVLFGSLFAINLQPQHRIFLFPVVAGWMLVVAFAAFCWPTYLRISPGRPTFSITVF